MSKSVSVYLDDRDIEVLDRLARSERRSRSAMVSELIRRYGRIVQAEGLTQHPLFRSFGSGQLAQFVKEDRKSSAKELSGYRKLLGLT